jgi:plastocyanin
MTTHMNRDRRNILLLLAAGLACVAGQPKASREDVSIKNGAFSPATAAIAPNDSVEWSNDDQRDHRITADDGSFDSGKLKPGDSFSKKFTKAGTWGYSCALHPREKGKVVVKK